MIKLKQKDLEDIGYIFEENTNHPKGIRGEREGHIIWFLGEDEGIFSEDDEVDYVTLAEVEKSKENKDNKNG